MVRQRGRRLLYLAAILTAALASPALASSLSRSTDHIVGGTQAKPRHPSYFARVSAFHA